MGATVLMSYLRPLVTDLGLSSILLFPSLGGQKQLSDGFDASKNPLLRVASRIKEAFPSLCLIADVCLCTFTETGTLTVVDLNYISPPSLNPSPFQDTAASLMMQVVWTMRSQ